MSTARGQYSGDLVRSPSKTSNDHLRETIAKAAILDRFLSLEHNLGWQKGAILDLVRFRFDASGVQVMFKAHKGQERRVAFVNARNLSDAFDIAGIWVESDALKWRPDKYG